MALLEVENLDVRYGRTHAVKALSLTLGHAEIVTVLGANGAGKSSLLKALQGTVPAAAGTDSTHGTGRDAPLARTGADQTAPLAIGILCVVAFAQWRNRSLRAAKRTME